MSAEIRARREAQLVAGIACPRKGFCFAPSNNRAQVRMAANIKFRQIILSMLESRRIEINKEICCWWAKITEHFFEIRRAWSVIEGCRVYEAEDAGQRADPHLGPRLCCGFNSVCAKRD
jgi:hypothetical protein